MDSRGRILNSKMASIRETSSSYCEKLLAETVRGLYLIQIFFRILFICHIKINYIYRIFLNKIVSIKESSINTARYKSSRTITIFESFSTLAANQKLQHY